MIKSFKCAETQKIWNGYRSHKIPYEIQHRAVMKLRLLDVAITLNDLKIPYSNSLESLKGDRKGQWSIRINQQWRLCFQWNNAEVFDVEIVDYH